MESLQEAALETAIAIEVRSLSLYRAMAMKVKNIRTKQVLESLAHEEAGHLESFCNLYPGTDDKLVEILGKNSIYADPHYCSLLDSVNGNTTEKDALQIALKEEQSCIEWYSAFVESLREPLVRNVFVRILDETNKHCELIADEYMHFMNKVDRADRNIIAG